MEISRRKCSKKDNRKRGLNGRALGFIRSVVFRKKSAQIVNFIRRILEPLECFLKNNLTVVGLTWLQIDGCTL